MNVTTAVKPAVCALPCHWRPPAVSLRLVKVGLFRGVARLVGGLVDLLISSFAKLAQSSPTLLCTQRSVHPHPSVLSSCFCPTKAATAQLPGHGAWSRFILHRDHSNSSSGWLFVDYFVVGASLLLFVNNLFPSNYICTVAPVLQGGSAGQQINSDECVSVGWCATKAVLVRCNQCVFFLCPPSSGLKPKTATTHQYTHCCTATNRCLSARHGQENISLHTYDTSLCVVVWRSQAPPHNVAVYSTTAAVCSSKYFVVGVLLL